MYDHTVATTRDWVGLQAEVIVDPMIYRAGEIFLAGSVDPRQTDQRWEAVAKDIGALVSFFDLLVLHDRLPAFNYGDTYDEISCGFDCQTFHMVNDRVKVIHQVDVQASAYMASKTAALDALSDRVREGSPDLLPPTLQQDLVDELSALEYRWNPSLGQLEQAYEGPAKTAAAFLLGSLVFSTYSQQTGAPHVMSPKRSRLFAASALTVPRGSADVEADLYSELDRRFRDEGDGWRDRTLPWTPSFVPWLLQDVDPYRLRPVDLLDKVFELRDKRSVTEYRQIRARALAGDDAAHAELTKLADAMAQALRVDRAELGETRSVLVELLPKAFGAAAGAALGVAAGPVGAAGGALLGIAGEEIIKRVTGKIWGFVFAGLPFISARKLLLRAVRADHTTTAELTTDLRKIWQTPAPRPT